MSTSDHNSANKEIEKLLKNVAEEEGFISYKTEKGDSSVKGDGYLGIITGVQVVGKDENNTDKILNVVVKSASKNDTLRTDAELESLFDREIYMYDTVFPTFKKFEMERGLKPSRFGPKFYKGLVAKKNETLILENLKENGYRLYERRKTMNEDHVSLVMTQYGRLHALTLALRDQNIEKFYSVTSSMDDVYMKILKAGNFVKAFQFRSRKAMEALDPTIDKEAIEVYEDFIINTIGTFTDKLHEFVDDYSVILHGDSWSNNMMFKYEDSNDLTKPTKVSFIDFQLSRLGPPALDLAYFFYACSSKEIISNLDHYLKLYYNSLSSHLLKLGSNPHKIFPYSVFKQQWADYAKFGLITSPIIIHVMLSEKDEAVDLSEVAASGENITDAFNYEIANVNTYNSRIKPVILHFVENKFI